MAADPRVAKHREKFSRLDAMGPAPALIEAVSEGVVFTTPEHSIGEADSIAVLRPRLTREQTKELVARALAHAGNLTISTSTFSARTSSCARRSYIAPAEQARGGRAG